MAKKMGVRYGIKRLTRNNTSDLQSLLDPKYRKPKFKLTVTKLKCIGCDLIFLVEKFMEHPSKQHHCPKCKSRILVHKLGDINIVEEISN